MSARVLESPVAGELRRSGYVVFPRLLPARSVSAYCEVLHALVDHSRTLTQSDGGYCLSPDAAGRPMPGVLHKVQGVCVVEPKMLSLASEPMILDPVQALLGPDLDVFGTKFFPMITPNAASTGWHQDNHYFGTNSERIVSCAIYLEKTDRDNGCLQVVPGSHLGANLVPHQDGTGLYAHGQWAHVDPATAEDVICPAGTVVLFSANLLHGARPNRSSRSSYRIAWHYVPGDLDLPMFRRGEYADRHALTQRDFGRAGLSRDRL